LTRNRVLRSYAQFSTRILASALSASSENWEGSLLLPYQSKEMLGPHQGTIKPISLINDPVQHATGLCPDEYDKPDLQTGFLIMRKDRAMNPAFSDHSPLSIPPWLHMLNMIHTDAF
jgi:hypothetical protein